MPIFYEAFKEEEWKYLEAYLENEAQDYYLTGLVVGPAPNLSLIFKPGRI